MQARWVGLVVGLVAGACSAEEPELNHPPFVSSSSPAEGAVIVLPSEETRDITVAVGDLDRSDRLFVRFLIDYPGAAAGAGNLLTDLSLPPSGEVLRAPVRLLPTCASVDARHPNPHRLVLSVSDRPFRDIQAGQSVDPEAPFDTVGEDGHRVRVVWLLDMKCP